MASQNCFSNFIKSHGFLHLFPSNMMRLGKWHWPPKYKGGNWAVLQRCSPWCHEDLHLSTLCLKLSIPPCVSGQESPSGEFVMHRLPPVTASPHLPAWAKILLLVTFQVNWKGAERGSQESKGASSQGHALWKEVGRKPYERLNTGRAGVGSLFMSGFNNFWNVVYILRKGCNKSSLTLSKWSGTHPCVFWGGLLFGYRYGFVGGVENVRCSALMVGELPEPFASLR